MTLPIQTILHMDMDAFYASVEQRDRPELRGRPVVVGAPPNRRGVVSTASYEARAFGIHSAMPSRTAGRLCPHAVFVAPRMETYEEVSRQVMAIAHEFTPLVEPLSLDEAFLDVRGALRLWPDAVAIAREIKRRVRERTALTVSVGVAVNKFLAKVASDLEKPDGLTVVPASESEILAFLAPLPATKIWGIGKKSAARLDSAGLRTIGQLQAMSEAQLRPFFGTDGARHVWELARGRDERTVETEWEEKSISAENTFDRDCASMDVVRQTLLELAERVGARLRGAGKRARTAQVKIRFSDFTTITRRATFPAPADTDRALVAAARRLFERERVREPVRLIGFGVSNLESNAGGVAEQPALFPDPESEPNRPRDRAIDRAVDRLRDRFGRDAVKRGDWSHSDEGLSHVDAGQRMPAVLVHLTDCQAHDRPVVCEDGAGDFRLPWLKRRRERERLVE